MTNKVLLGLPTVLISALNYLCRRTGIVHGMCWHDVLAIRWPVQPQHVSRTTALCHISAEFTMSISMSTVYLYRAESQSISTVLSLLSCLLKKSIFSSVTFNFHLSVTCNGERNFSKFVVSVTFSSRLMGSNRTDRGWTAPLCNAVPHMEGCAL